jgi:hypothetical protein
MALTTFTAEEIAGAGKTLIFQLVQNKFSVFKCLPPTCSGSAYFTLETIPPDDGLGYPAGYVEGADIRFVGSTGIDRDTYIKDNFKFSFVVPPGGGVCAFIPNITINGGTSRVRGTGGYGIEITH